MHDPRDDGAAHRAHPWRAEDFLGYQPQDVERRLHRAQTQPDDFDADPFAEEVALSARERGVLQCAAAALGIAGLLLLAAWVLR